MPVTPISASQATVGASGHPGSGGALISNGPTQPIYVAGEWPAGTKAAKYFIVWNNAGSLVEVGSFIVPVGMAGTFAVVLNLPAGSYMLSAMGTPGSIGVYSGIYSKGSPGDGWSIGLLDAELTKSMFPMAAPVGALGI